MVAPYLPPEVIDHIIDMLLGDTESLLSCSVVSTNWVHRCRHHLFASIKLHSLSDLCLWFKSGLGPSNHHVRSLDLAQGDEFKWIISKALTAIQIDFTSFRNVQSLSLTGLDFTLFDEYSLTRFFGHLSDRLTSLSVKGFTMHPGALLFFVCMFPKLDDLKIDRFTMGEATVPFRKPAITPRFRGKLVLSKIKSNGTSIIAFLVDLPIAFEDVCVENCRFETPKVLKDLFVACQETTKRIKVSKIFFDNTSQKPLVDLSPCKGLVEMQLSLIQLRQPSHWIEPILQTITSNRVQKITFDADLPTTIADIDAKIDIYSWSSLDAVFSRMANLICPTDGRLELVFNALAPEALGNFNPIYPGRFLEGCRTKAMVRFEPVLSS